MTALTASLARLTDRELDAELAATEYAQRRAAYASDGVRRMLATEIDAIRAEMAARRATEEDACRS